MTLNTFKKLTCILITFLMLMSVVPVQSLVFAEEDGAPAVASPVASEEETGPAGDSPAVGAPPAEGVTPGEVSPATEGEEVSPEEDPNRAGTTGEAGEAGAGSEAQPGATVDQPEAGDAATDPAGDLPENVNNVEIDGKFLFNKETNTIVRYLGSEAVVEIPAQLTHEGVAYPVEHIGTSAFAVGTASGITSVTLPDGLKTIGETAFKGAKLTALTLPASLTEIGKNAFLGNELATLTLADDSKLSQIGEGAFSNNKLVDLDLSKATTLVELAKAAFENNNLKTVILPTTTTFTTIGDEVFYSNYLNEVIVPDSITTYGTDVFADNDKFVTVKSKSAVVKSQAKLGAFGSVVNPVVFYIRGVDVSGAEILSVTEFKNDLTQELSLAELLSVGNDINIKGPAIPGYLSESLVMTPLTEEFVKSHARDNPYVFHYQRNEDKPVIKGLDPLRVDINGEVDFMAGVTAETAAGEPISPAKIKHDPKTIDTSFEKIHKVTYSVVDDSGNKGTGVRTIIVGNDIMEMETGKGWIMRDFTYENGKVTGFSPEGVAKLATNREVVLPAFDPTDVNDLKPIKAIGANAFADRELLTVVLPENITTIEENAFKGNKLSSVALPDTLTSIGASAFKDNSLTTVTLPDALETLGASAFENNKLSVVAIPNKITEIAEAVFKNNKLSSVALHDEITAIGNSAFEKNALTKVTIPSKVTTLGDLAFADNKLETVAVPDSVTSAGEYAFARNKLDSFTLGTGLAFVNKGMFQDNKLTKFALPENIKAIKESAFEQNNLSSLEIPSHVAQIGDGAFRQNYLLKTVAFHDGLESIGVEAFHKVDLAMDELVFPDTLRTIGDRAFYGDGTSSRIYKIKFNEGLDTIGNHAFARLALREIQPKTDNNPGKLPESLTSLGTAVFRDNSLSFLKLPQNITVVPSELAHNNRLQDIELSAATTQINNYAFSNNNLNILDLKNKTPMLQTIGDNAFRENSNLRKVTTPDTLTVIGSNAFYNNSKLSDLTLGSGLNRIGESAFQNNSALTSVIFPDGLTRIDGSAFRNAKLTAVSLPDSVTSLGGYVFQGNNLRSLKLSQGLTRIPDYAFDENKLSEVTIPAAVSEISREAFSGNNLVRVTVEPNSLLKAIRNRAFDNNQLSDITLPHTVTTIDADVFVNNPGDQSSPGVVRVYIKNGADVAPTAIPDSHYMMINSTPITVYSLEQGTDRYVKNPEVVFKRIGERAEFVGEANKYYSPVNLVPTEIDVTEQPQRVDIYYRKTPEFNPRNIQLDMQFTNAQKAKLGYGLKDEDRRRDYLDFLIEINITDESVINGQNPYLDIDFNNPNPGSSLVTRVGNLSLNELFYSNDYIRIEAAAQSLFARSEAIRENGNSLKLRLYFKPGILKPGQSQKFNFRYRGSQSAPHNSILDFTGAVSFGTADSKTPLATTDPENRIGVRHLRDLPGVYKSGPSNLTYAGENYTIEKNGQKYASANIVPEAEYVISLDMRDYYYRKYDYAKMKAIDILPTYKKWDDGANAEVDAYPELDVAKSTNWQYLADSENKKVEFIGPDVREISKFPIYLKFPGIRDRSSFLNRIELNGQLGTNEVKVLNGNREEADAVFRVAKPAYENEVPHTTGANANDGYSTTVYVADTYDRDPNERGSYNKNLQVYKRTHSFFGGNNSTLFPEGTDTSRGYHWNYNGTNYSQGNLTYRYRPHLSSDGGSYYYISYMPNTEKYRSKTIEYFIELIYANGNAKNLVYKDTNLDDLLKYKSITIPQEIKSATLKLYTSNNASGEPSFTTTIYNDPYILTPEQQNTVRSYVLELNGELEGTPFTVSRARMSNTVEFKNPEEAIVFENNRHNRELRSNSNLNGTVFYESRGSNDLRADYWEGFAVTNGQDVISRFEKKRVAPLCPIADNEGETEEECRQANTETSDIFPGKRLSFQYKVNVTGFLSGEYTDFLLYDKLPEGIEFVEFKLEPAFANLVEGLTVETSADATGRTIVKLKAAKVNFAKGADIDLPVAKEMVIGRLETRANAEIKNNNYTNFGYLSVAGVNSPRNENVKNNLGSKNDPDLVQAFADAKYTSVMEGNARYRASFPLGVLGEVTEKFEGSNTWTPTFMKIPTSGAFNYRVRMANQDNTERNSYTAFGILPYTGDLNVVPNQKGEFLPRGTNMVGKRDDGTSVTGKISLTGPIKIADDSKSDEGADPYYEVRYTFKNPQEMQNELADNLVMDESIWLDEAAVNGQWDKVTGYKIISKKPFAPSSHDDYILPMTAPENPDYLFDNLPFSEEFLIANGLKNNKIVFKFANAANPISHIEGGATAFRRSAFVATNRVEAILESPKGSIEIIKKGYRTAKENPQGIDENEEAFLERLPALEGATFELYMVGKEKVDPASALVPVTEKFPELANLVESDRRKEIPTILEKKIISEPVRVLVNGQLRTKLTTDELGKAKFTGLFKNRDYILREVEEPEGFNSHISEKWRFIDHSIFASDAPVKNVLNTTNLFMPLRQPAASVGFRKLDSIGNPIPFTRFKLVKLNNDDESEQPEKYLKTDVTDDSGYLKFENLPLGKYKLVEVGPRGTLQPIEPIIFMAKARYEDSDIIRPDADISDYHYDLVFKEPILNNKAKLDVYKLGIFDVNIQSLVTNDELTKLKKSNGKVLKDVQLRLTRVEDNYDQTKTTDGFGKATFTDLEINKDYLLTEVAAPEGFEQYTKEYRVKINEIGLIFINGVQHNYDYAVMPNIPTENTNRIDIKKVDQSEPPVPLANAEFTLYEVLGDGSLQEVKKGTTDDNGDLSFKDFGLDETGTPVVKTFKLKETVPPLGYKVGDAEFEFTTNGGTFSYFNKTIENPKIELIVNKTDADTTAPLSGAAFTLYEEGQDGTLTPVLDDTGAEVKVVTNNAGTAKFNYAKFDIDKIYAIKETQAPTGYKLKEQPIRFDLRGLANTATFNGVHEINVENTYKKGRISLYKYDADTKAALAGVKFELAKKGSNQKIIGRTKADGKLVFENLDLATYILTEKTPLTGYETTDPLEMTLTDAELHIRRNIPNTRRGGTFSLHKTSEKGHKLQNAKFSLEKSIRGDYHFGNPTYATTDREGVLSFADLQNGYVYRLREVEPDTAITPNTAIGAGDGYEIAKNTWYITPKVADDGTIQFTMRKAGTTAETELPNALLTLENKRKVPQKVLVFVDKTLNGGAALNPMPAFRVKLKRGTDAAALEDVPNSTVTLEKQENGHFQYTYRDLDFDTWDETSQKWIPYIYAIEELPVANFAPQYTNPETAAATTAHRWNFAIVNTYTPPVKTIKGSKIWENGGAKNPETHLALFRKVATDNDFNLVENSIQTVPVGNKERTEYTWNNMPETDAAGRTYEYKVDETDAQGAIINEVTNFHKSLRYDQENDKFEVTNTYSSPNNKVLTVEKEWVNGPDEKPTIYFRLYRKIASDADYTPVADTDLINNQKAIKEVPSGTRVITYTDLAATDNNANEYTYIAKETDATGNELDLMGMYNDETNKEAYQNVKYSYAAPAYDNAEAGVTKITNTFVIPKTEIKAKKVWVNGPAQKPETWLTLYRKVGETGALAKVEAVASPKYTHEIITVGEATEVETTYTDLDLTTDKGAPYIYVVRESDAAGNDAAPKNFVNDNDSKTREALTITNTYQSPRETLRFTKKWLNGQYFRPEVSFKLYRTVNDKKEAVPDVEEYVLPDVPTAELADENELSFTFENIATHNDQDQPYTFSIEEINRREAQEEDPGTYEVTTSDDLRTLTNRFVSKNMALTVTKVWQNVNGERPKVYFKLYRVLNEPDVANLALDIPNEPEEVVLTREHFVHPELVLDPVDGAAPVDGEAPAEGVEPAERNEAEAAAPAEAEDDAAVNPPVPAAAITKILIPKQENQQEIVVELQGLPYAAANAVPYRYFVKEFDQETDREFAKANYKVEYLPDGLTVKNTYHAPGGGFLYPLSDPGAKDKEPNKTVETNKKPKNPHQVVPTATKDTMTIYLILSLVSFMALVYLTLKTIRSSKKKDAVEK